MTYHPLTLAACAASFALPLAANAAPTVTAGGALTFGFAAEDDMNHSSTTGEAFIGVENNGFHGELWIGSLYQDPNDDAEIELSFGYGSEAGSLGYDISYIGYFLSDDGYQSSGIGFELSHDLTAGIAGALYFEVDTDTGDLTSELSLSGALSDKLELHGMIGAADADDNTYGEIGLAYGLSDTTALEVLYEDADDSEATISLILSFEIGLLGG
ncbi:hypothetical protein [Litorivita pollutaquae]|uniref:hypothetical protein n=1 Tax=Litorivita pollutaquae TaxID=2200892 RepID=UPI0013A6498D|nr:hypothetical protein [Litorivita pollutaquae]